MKKSEIYRMAQIAVLNSNFSNLDKLEVMRELIDREDMAILVEKRETEKAVEEE